MRNQIRPYLHLVGTLVNVELFQCGGNTRAWNDIRDWSVVTNAFVWKINCHTILDDCGNDRMFTTSAAVIIRALTFSLKT